MRDNGGAGPTIARLLLGVRLRDLREQARITGSSAAASIRSSSSKISRIESGQLPARKADVAKLLTRYGISDGAERADMLELASESDRPGRWDMYAEELPASTRHCLELEAAASMIVTYDSVAIPSLLQTAGYAQALWGLPPSRWRGGGLTPELLVHRRSVLVRECPQLWALIDESALRRTPASREILDGQIAHLVDAGSRPHISIQLVPLASPAPLAVAGPFSVLRFTPPELPDLVLLEQQTGMTMVHRPRDVDRYWQTVNYLGTHAWQPETSMTEIRSAGRLPSS